MLFLCCCLSSGAVYAQSGLPQVFSSARTVFDSKTGAAPYRLYLSELKKINGQWQVDTQKTVIAKQRHITQELQSFLSFDEALSQLNAVTEKLKAVKLYACQSYDCGRSNGWANHYFKIKQLYGLDARQTYQVWQVSNATAGAKNNIAYWVLYLVERGNKRIYFHTDYLSDIDTEGDASHVVYDKLENNGFVVFEGLIKNSQGWTVTDQSVQRLAAFLSENPELMLRLVGHDYTLGTLEAQRKRSLNYAKQLKQQLVAIGINDKRLTTFGLGSLAPVGKRLEARIEIVSEP